MENVYDTFIYFLSLNLRSRFIVNSWTKVTSILQNFTFWFDTNQNSEQHISIWQNKKKKKKKTGAVEPAIKQWYEEISTKNQATRSLVFDIINSDKRHYKKITVEEYTN